MPLLSPFNYCVVTSSLVSCAFAFFAMGVMRFVAENSAIKRVNMGASATYITRAIKVFKNINRTYVTTKLINVNIIFFGKEHIVRINASLKICRNFN